MQRAILDQIIAARAAKRPVVLATNIESGAEHLLYPDEPVTMPGVDPAALEAASRADRSTTIETAEGTLFLHVYNPPLRMIIVGAVHIAQPLAKMASLTGYEVVIVDPRRSFATNERFPGVSMTHEWPDEALQRLAPDSRTAVITLTHDPKLDDPALTIAVRSPALYIGSLGSKKTHAARLERLRLEGLGETELARIHGPIGLAIGSRSPAEVAISIMAQVTERLRASPANA